MEAGRLHADGHRRVQQGARPRARRAAPGRPRGGPAALLPHPAIAGGARRRDGGRRADHARLQQLPRAHQRPAGDGRARATRSSATAPGSPARGCSTGRSTCTCSSSARSPSGWAPRRRSSSRRATRPTSGTLGTILAPGDTVIADSGDHASILDGCLLSRAKLRPFRHNRLDKLEKMLERAAEDGGGVLVVVDGVFSMEGDVAPLPQIVELCRAHGARLMVDEAHGAGVLGARGAGTAELFGVEDGVDLRMGTFSKSLASCGGFIAGSHEVIDFLRIKSRAFLFTAAAVPAAVGAALAALRVIRSDGRAAALRPRARERRVPQPRAARARLPRRRAAAAAGRLDGDDADRPGGRRRRLEGRAAVARALRRRRVRERRAAPGRAAGGRPAAHERDGDARPRHARPRARALRVRQGRVRVRARAAAVESSTRDFRLWAGRFSRRLLSIRAQAAA